MVFFQQPAFLRSLRYSPRLSKPATTTSRGTRITGPNRLFRRQLNMNAQELSSYLADAPPSVVKLEIAKHFDALADQQKRYAHFISK